MDRRTREELKESLKWIRWKKYRKNVKVVDSRIEYRAGKMIMVLTLRDDNKKLLKNVKIKKVMRSGTIIGTREIGDEYVNKRMGYRYER